jgi:hypothetical protein
VGFWDDDRAAPFEAPEPPVDDDTDALTRREGRLVVVATVMLDVLFALMASLVAPALRTDDRAEPPTGLMVLFVLSFLLLMTLVVVGSRYRRRRRPGVWGELTRDWRMLGEAVRVSGWLPAACWIAIVVSGALAVAAILPLVLETFF